MVEMERWLREREITEVECLVADLLDVVPRRDPEAVQLVERWRKRLDRLKLDRVVVDGDHVRQPRRKRLDVGRFPLRVVHPLPGVDELVRGQRHPILPDGILAQRHAQRVVVGVLP